MRISVKEAQQNLEEIVDRVESGEDVLLTRDGRAIARIVASETEVTVRKPAMTPEERSKVLDEIRAKAPPREPGEPTADRSHDFLYDENGLPA